MIAKVINSLHQLLLKTETGFLVGMLLLMIIIAVVQIVMRNFMGGGLIWAESLLRIMVLWIALLGAMVASRDQEHIAIDVLVNKLPPSFKNTVIRLTHITTAFICMTIAWFSWKLVIDEFQYGDIAFGVVPTWFCEVIIPFSFCIIALRYLIAAWLIKPSENLTG